MKTYWIIKHPIHGRATILPNTIRYSRNSNGWHPYGWQTAFWATIRKEDGTLAREFFGALGTTRRAAMSNALSR